MLEIFNTLNDLSNKVFVPNKTEDLNLNVFNIYLTRIFGSSYSNIYPEELQLGKKKNYKHEGSSCCLDIKIKDGKFQFCLFDKRDLFPFSIVRMPDK